MEGSVWYGGNRVKISAQLIDAATDEHLWSEIYERDFRDIFAIQADIAKHIATALEAELLPEERARLEIPPTVSEAAYALYLKALASTPNIGLGTPPEFFETLRQAVTLDPGFALAHATLAIAYALKMTLIENMEAPAREHAARAIELDQNQAHAYSALAVIDAEYLRFPEAEINFERAIELAPNDLEMLEGAGIFFAVTAQTDRAAKLMARAKQFSPNSLIWESWLHVGTRDYESVCLILLIIMNQLPTRIHL